MPPKKKKPPTNPIVVGTVSTRSTRRQSIVNIEIPKSSKTSSKYAKNVKEPECESSKQIKKADTKSSCNDLSQRIKASYNVVINKSTASMPKNDKKFPYKITYTKTTNKEQVKPPPKIVVPTIKRAEVKRPVKDYSAAFKTKGKLKSNKALLQILEDWTDDESEEEQTSDIDSNDDAEHIRNLHMLKIGEAEVNKIIGSVRDDDVTINVQKLVTGSDPSENQSSKQNDNFTIDSKLSEKVAEEIKSTDKSSTVDLKTKMETKSLESQAREIIQKNDLEMETNKMEEIIEECIVESTDGLLLNEAEEETVAFDEGDIIVECVTEEIIPEASAEIVLMDTSEINTTSVVIEDTQEINLEQDLENKFEDNEKEENITFEESSQSVSTCDSNDAEVRSFFAKEIENNEIVNEEDIPTLESENSFDSNKENVDSLQSVLEDNLDTHEEANTQERIINEQIEFSEPPVISEICSENEGGKRFDENLMKDSYEENQNFEMERVLTKEDVKKIILDTNEDSLENKVAGLHLIEKDVKTEDVSKIIANLKIKDEENLVEKKDDILKNEIKDEDVSMKSALDEQMYLKLEKENLEEMLEELSGSAEELLEKPKTSRRTRAIKQNNLKQKQSEDQLNEVKSTKQSKSVKATKEKKPTKNKENKTKEIKPPKEIKPRDGRSKKKISPIESVKKSKEKIDKIKIDKKDTTRKSSKLGIDQAKKPKSDTDYEDTEVRRSSRIKSISVLKKKTMGHGLVRSKSEPILNESDVSDSNSVQTESEKSTPSASPKVVGRERKTRWTRSSENLTDSQCTSDLILKNEHLSNVTNMDIDAKPKLPSKDPVVEARLKQFVHLKENLYKTDRMTCKEAKKMTCDCFLTSEEIEANEYGCGEDCLNRLLLIECGNLCQVGDRCTNKRFQKGQFAPIEVFDAEKKGLGLRAAANIPYGEFILEYVGEVLNCDEFDKRAEVYSQDKNIHYYFMSLRADAIIDATMKGNISRFINHSCDPNAETQKWTVNGELRIGFFSTRTILAGEEITFDYRFQRYGKEAQKCYCEAANCRGWLGEQPDEDSEDEDEEEEEEEEAETVTVAEKVEIPTPEVVEPKKIEGIQKPAEIVEVTKPEEIKVDKEPEKVTPTKPVVIVKRKSPRKKPRKEIFEDIDQLDEDIEMLVTTGLKNQAHTLKLSRLMVRAKEPTQRHKLLRILRRGELPCRRLFLDYHGLRLMHGYMIDAQHLVHTNKKYESLRLEVLQTLAVLPIPNKTMLQDSKVLPTVEKWAVNDLGSPLDSDSNSPENEQEQAKAPKESKEIKDSSKKSNEENKDEKPARSIEDQEEEIKFLATKLLEEWANLKEVFRIPKKERIEQMKEHEREANKKFMQSGYGNEQDSGRKSDRYRHLSRYKLERETSKKGSKSGEKPSAEFIRLSKIERRKLFALQHELKEEERRLKQREMWRQHELNCLLIGTDPRFTAPFDPSRGYQCIWNPQIGQWQNYPLPPQNQTIFSSQPPTPSTLPPPLPNLSMPPPQLQIPKSIPNFPYAPQIGITTSLTASISNIPIPTSMNTGISHSANMGMPQPNLGIPTSLNGTVPQLPTSMGIAVQPQPLPPSSVSQMHVSQQLANLPSSVPQINAMQGIPGALPQNIPTLAQIPASMQGAHIPVPQYQEPIKKEEDPSQVKFMGPIPPPVKLPPKWKCAKDKYGRPYYYHVKLRKSQWEPPPFVEKIDEPEEISETESSSETSSVSSDTSSENSDSGDEIDDTKLLMEVRKQMEKSTKLSSIISDIPKTEEAETSSPEFKNSDDDADIDDELNLTSSFIDDDIERPSIDKRLKEQFDLLKDDKPPRKRRRLGLCEEILISPRTEEDKLQFKEDLKRYKANKEKLKRQKELILQQTRKQLKEVEMKKSREKRQRTSVKNRIKEMPDFNSENARKIKENFRANMASTVVGALNNYRKPDCKEGRITNTDDFKHLARKLTHFVMLKEMKHIARIDDLTCTDNVKSKAREYIKKYMSKFGEVYIKRNDSPDFKD